MMYKSFSTQKNKLSKLELENKKQANAISLKQWIETQIINRVNNTQPRNTTLPLSGQWDSDWVTVNNLEVEGSTPQQWYTWRIIIGEFNTDWLSRFSIEVVCKDVGGLYRISSAFYKFIGWEFTDVIGNETSKIKNIVLVVSISSKAINTEIFQAKLLVKYIAQACHD